MDRSVVWAEIDSILAAIDPNRASWVALLDSVNDNNDGPNSAAVLDFLVSLEDWATLNRLEEVIPAMLTHGFDCASFINGVIGEADLQEMGIKCPATRRKFLTAATDLPRGINTVAASLTHAATVETFLQRLCLQQHLAIDFADLRLSLIDSLAGVTDTELREKFRIRKLGHRRRILRCLNRLPPMLLMQPQSLPLALRSVQPPQVESSAPAGEGGKVICNNQGSTSSSINSSTSSGNFSSATAELAKTTGQPNVQNQQQQALVSEKLQSARKEELDRATTRCRSLESVAAGDPPAKPTFRPVTKPGWPHHPNVLLGGSVAYSVSYLGFRPLENHTDRSELGQVMQTFRCKSADILKLPQICLAVSYRGVKFVNPDNQMLITEHRITDIYFASQDNTRPTNFAYVSKDSSSGIHYCHCFASHSQDATILIINTLSEACCLANQLIEYNQKRGSIISSAGGGVASRTAGSDRRARMLQRLDCDIDHF